MKDKSELILDTRELESTVYTPTKEGERKVEFDTERKVDFDSEIDVFGSAVIKLKKL